MCGPTPPVDVVDVVALRVVALVVAALAAHHGALADVAREVGGSPMAEHEGHRIQPLPDPAFARRAARVVLGRADGAVALVLRLAKVGLVIALLLEKKFY